MNHTTVFSAATLALLSMAATADATTTIAAIPNLWTVWSGGPNTCPANSHGGQDGSGACNFSDDVGSSTNPNSNPNTLYADFPLVVVTSSVNVKVMASGSYDGNVLCETQVCTSTFSCSNTGYKTVGTNSGISSINVGSISVPSGGYAFISCQVPTGGTVYSFTY